MKDECRDECNVFMARSAGFAIKVGYATTDVGRQLSTDGKVKAYLFGCSFHLGFHDCVHSGVEYTATPASMLACPHLALQLELVTFALKCPPLPVIELSLCPLFTNVLFFH